ncbi:uncharacterized protein EI97DRAFT_432117 [Westerdykella ornata]|uniref:Rhodopsin domain-containing protein n=1 Tax=Westerdykella ornata TaxID=318751 RepID=A0A6A6JND9_WESOR|nr:uncharacterized protein EI97DRAFT_432117 [Westerdykella ornata]KAF2278032.1 hypothetical protein EI97DRAFT_432117 [Westerdykella ornata]
MFMSIPGPAAILGSIIPLLVLDIFAVGLRFYSRRKRRQPLQTDDWLTVPALVLAIGLASIMFYGIDSTALGYPAPPMPDTETGVEKRSAITASDWKIVTARKLEYSFLVIFATTNGLIKMSVLFLYRRLFVVDKQNWTNGRNVFFITMITLMGLWATSYTFAFMFMCKGNFEILFTDLLAVMEQCVNTFMVGYSCSISDFISDALIVLIPIPFVWQLHLPLGKKLAVLGVFLLGILSSGASLVRMLWMIWANHIGMDEAVDEGLLLTSELYWCLMEITLGLLAACLPTLRGLVQTKSVDSVLRSVRNALSLGSTSSASQLASSKDSTAKSSRSLDRDVYSVNVETKVTQEDRAAHWV